METQLLEQRETNLMDCEVPQGSIGEIDQLDIVHNHLVENDVSNIIYCMSDND